MNVLDTCKAYGAKMLEKEKIEVRIRELQGNLNSLADVMEEMRPIVGQEVPFPSDVSYVQVEENKILILKHGEEPRLEKLR